mmetsp:Transcript_40806/g.93978  ORF Transcript_40806/g.93978 Transcript_40806/m.93978 type:complete len:284 (+) Transcript_40806:73-924(+)
MTERGFRIATDVNKEGWEKATFPVLCETCLGDNPYVRMQKEEYGVECKICVRPFTLFRWKAGTKGRYKATVICQQCARVKNVCQTCLFDLEYGLPVQVRDKFLEAAGGEKVQLPASRVGRDFALQELQKDKDGEDLPYGKTAAHPMLKKLARMQPYYKRNEARICSFYVKGACNRGADCPFRHELPEGGELANQKLRDRFHGENDPVARKLLRRADDMKAEADQKEIAREEKKKQLAAGLNPQGAQQMVGDAQGMATSSGDTYKPYYPSMDPAAAGNAPLSYP